MAFEWASDFPPPWPASSKTQSLVTCKVWKPSISEIIPKQSPIVSQVTALISQAQTISSYGHTRSSQRQSFHLPVTSLLCPSSLSPLLPKTESLQSWKIVLSTDGSGRRGEEDSVQQAREGPCRDLKTIFLSQNIINQLCSKMWNQYFYKWELFRCQQGMGCMDHLISLANPM